MAKVKLPSDPKGSQQGKALAPVDKEIILQVYAVCNNKRETARRLNFAESTVHRVLNEFGDDKLDEARSSSMLDMAGKFHALVETMIEKAGDKLDTASLSQIMIGSGIGTDKIIALQKRAEELMQKRDAGALSMPSDISGMLSAINGSVTRLRVLGVDIEAEQPDLAAKLQDALVAAEVQSEETPVAEEMRRIKEAKVADAEIVEPEPDLDFDNPGADAATSA